MRCRTYVPLPGIGVSGLVVLIAVTQVVLPGTQPEEGGIKFAKVAKCYMCHAKTKNGSADPFLSWQGGMMAQAMRDPVFRAALTIANQDIEGVGEFCLRCHTPRGWLEGRSTPTDGSALNREDLHGVSCEPCHRLVDPLSTEAGRLAKSVPPGYGNAMMVVDPANVVRGPYADTQGAMPHRTMKSEFHASSQLCGVCHNVSNPTLASDVYKQPPWAYGHVERTYSEWALSNYAKQERDGTCQSCHYPTVPGGGQATRFASKHRSHFVKHGPVGGSTWVQDAIVHLWPNEGGAGLLPVNRLALENGKQRARKLLRTAASLKLSFPQPGKARLRITNLTGHKLPTGYPEGRRMWVNVRFLDASGQVLREIGRYGDKQDTIFGKTVTAPTLLDPDQTRVYESLPAISEMSAKKLGKPAGPSFHFVLNDAIAKDNRIPPRGFKNTTFAKHLCEPVGATYADGQHWDDVELDVPNGTKAVAVRLMYQSVSWEYLKFLAEENRSDEWGKRLYEAWTETGRCAPEIVAEITRKIGVKAD